MSGMDGKSDITHRVILEQEYESIIAIADKGLTIRITHAREPGARGDYKKFYWSRMSWHKNPNDKWMPLENIFKLHSLLVTKEWNADLISTEYWMSEHHEGGGLYGVDPEYHSVRANLISKGRQILKEQNLQADIEKHGNRKAKQ